MDEVPARTIVEPLPKKGNLYIDFEFNRTWQRNVNLVCAVVRYNKQNYRFWLHNDKQAQRYLANQLDKWCREYRVVTYGAIAEARAFISLGLNPLDYEFIDLWAETKQLHNHNNRYQYGRYMFAGQECVSQPPHMIPAMNRGRDMREIGTSLVESTYFFLGIIRDSAEKAAMRRIIIEDRPNYTKEEATRIMGYCEEDVTDLPQLQGAISVAEMEELHWDAEKLLKVQIGRGEDSCSMALCEVEGIPLDIEATRNLSRNVESANREIIANLNEKYYRFFDRNEDGSYTQKYEYLEAWVRENGLYSKWPKTTSGKLATDEDVLEDFSGAPAINQLRRVRKILGQLKWFREEAWDNFISNVDVFESRLRVWLSPFGTQSNRNAPPAKLFVPAMSNWLRCLIRPMKGFAITGTDWSSQEFAIAAVLSKDPKMIEAYKSGDPYVFFAKEAGAIPKDANNKWVKKPQQAPEELRETYQGYSEIRDLFKATVLGLQYGMGAEKLSRKLTMDTGRIVTVAEATQLRDMHKRVFHVYWAWLDGIESVYKTQPLSLYDGWTMFMDNMSTLSVKNFPVQGTGSAIMRIAVIKAQRLGVKVLFPLHDAIYILHEEGDTEAITILEKCMDEAVTEVLGDSLYIRHESKTVTHDDVWVEGRGREMYELLSKYLKEPDEDTMPVVKKKRSTTRKKKVIDESNQTNVDFEQATT